MCSQQVCCTSNSEITLKGWPTNQIFVLNYHQTAQMSQNIEIVKTDLFFRPISGVFCSISVFFRPNCFPKKCVFHFAQSRMSSMMAQWWPEAANLSRPFMFEMIYWWSTCWITKNDRKVSENVRNLQNSVFLVRPNLLSGRNSARFAGMYIQSVSIFYVSRSLGLSLQNHKAIYTG